MTMTAPEPDVLALAAFRRLATSLRRAAVELRGVTSAPGSGLHEAAEAVDEIAELIFAEPEPVAIRATVAGDPYDLLPEG
jgi:hypothetical protein